MSKFKLGQEIVAIKYQPEGKFKKGDEFIVDGLSCCNKCGLPCVYLKGLYNNVRNIHSACGGRFSGREMFAESDFAPKQSFADSICEKIANDVEAEIGEV